MRHCFVFCQEARQYQILIISSILSGFLIVYLANRNFIHTRLYYFLFIFGIIVSCLGFLLEYTIKYFKRKSVDSSFSYFLQDLSREYKIKKNLSLALINISESNVYGSIDSEIKRIANRVSWGEDFESALINVNETIKSSVIDHTLILLKTFKDSSIPLERLLLNISKDLSVFKEETQKKKYFLNLYYLSIVLFFIFLIVILFINILLGSNFLWYGDSQTITRLFFDNFLLYIAIILSIFISFIMSSIREETNFSFIKYVSVFFIIIILLFQIFVPKPDAENVLIETINHMNKENIEYFEINNVVSLKSISSRYLLDNTFSENIYFVSSKNRLCGVSCAEYVILVNDAVFLNFQIEKQDINFIIYYEILK